MTYNQKILLGILFLGLIFSSMFGINFNLVKGFEFKGFWFNIIPFKLLDFARADNTVLLLTSRILGYFIYALFGLLLIKDFKVNRTGMISYITYLLIVFYAIYFEGTSLFQDMKSNYSGQHLWIGTILFLLGLFNFNRKFKVFKFSKMQTLVQAQK